MIILRLINNKNIEQRQLRGYNECNYYWRTCCIMCFYRKLRGFARPRCRFDGKIKLGDTSRARESAHGPCEARLSPYADFQFSWQH